MNPVENKCWSCERCNKVFGYNSFGKEEAEQCCKCVNCHTTTYMEYTGTSKYQCKKCLLEAAIPIHENSIESSVERLRLAKNELKELIGNK